MNCLSKLFIIMYFVIISNYILCNSDDLTDLFNTENTFDMINNIDDAHSNVVRVFGYDDTYSLLFALDPQKIVSSPLYFSTRPIITRNIVSQSIFDTISSRYALPLMTSFKQNNSVCGSIFCNQTYSAYLDDNHTDIQHYIDMKQQSLIDVAHNASFDFPYLDILDLFSSIKVQDRKIGSIFSYDYVTTKYAISFKMPLIYQERNFYVSVEDRMRIANHPLFVNFEGDYMAFVKKHLIADKIGIGDVLCNIEIPIVNATYHMSTVGLSLTLPTNYSFKNGLYGSYFNPFLSSPRLDIHKDIIDLGLSGYQGNQVALQQAQSNIAALGLNALDRLSTILLDAPLGDYRHIGLGIAYNFKFQFSDSLSLISQLSAQFLLPAYEYRFYRYNHTVDELDPLNFTGSEREYVHFISSKIVEKLFPMGIDTLVMPGQIVRQQFAFYYKKNTWLWSVGSDIYLQTPETILYFDLQDNTNVLNRLAIDKCKKNLVFESKAWASFAYHDEHSLWFIKGLGDITMFSKKIGHNYTVALSLCKDF